jgi:hypothetical protein
VQNETCTVVNVTRQFIYVSCRNLISSDNIINKKSQVIEIYYSDSGYPELLGIINVEYCRGKKLEFFLVNTLFIFKHYKPYMLICVVMQQNFIFSSDFQPVFLKISNDVERVLPTFAFPDRQIYLYLP